MDKQKRLNKQRITRKYRVSNAVKRHATRPRLCVYRSDKHIYAQVIDDDKRITVASASTNDKDFKSEGLYGGNKTAAAIIGKALAEKALSAGVTKVAFDRKGHKYHGRIKALADAARDAGLEIGSKGEAE